MLICAAHGYPGEGRPDVETFVGAKLPFGELRVYDTRSTYGWFHVQPTSSTRT